MAWDPRWFDRAWVGPYGVSFEDFTGEETEDTDQACLRWLVDDDGEIVGFWVMPSDYIPLDESEQEDSPRFHVPALGLTFGTVDDILLAADDRWGIQAGDDVITFHGATTTENSPTADDATLLKRRLKAVGGRPEEHLREYLSAAERGTAAAICERYETAPRQRGC